MISNQKENGNSDEESSPDGLEVKYNINNIVATVELDLEKEKIDLVRVSRKHVDCEYNPERFPGLVMRVEKPRATLLIFATGKMVITGLRFENDAELVVGEAMEVMNEAGIKTSNPKITIRNMVASGTLGKPLDLNMGAMVLDNAMYEPEVFPGLVYRPKDPKCVFLLFATGSFVCTGAKDRAIIKLATEKLKKTISGLGMIVDSTGKMDPHEDMVFI